MYRITFHFMNPGNIRQIVTLFDHIHIPLETYDLDQRFLMKDNTMIFMFHDPDFFSDLFHNGTNQADNDDNDRQKRYGKLLYVDFEGKDFRKFLTHTILQRRRSAAPSQPWRFHPHDS